VLRQKNYELARQEYQHVINVAPQELARALRNAKESSRVDRAISLFLEKCGHIEGTSLPGQMGNVGIAGHRDGYFRKLAGITTGDLFY
jgi:hypothetical protein